MMSKIDRLAAYISDLQAGGGIAARHLSPSFGRHRGLDGPGWVAREEPEFSGRSLGGFSIQRLPELEGMNIAETRFVVLSDQGDLIYEDRIGFDTNGLLVGDQAPVELISKLEFHQNRPPQRALACRVAKGELRQVIPRDPAIQSAEVIQAAAEDADGFTRLRIKLNDDDGSTCLATLRFYFDWGAETVTTLLRGTDHPLFEPDNYARIRGAVVTLPKHPERLWRITVIMANGATEILARSTMRKVTFDQPPIRVIVTDPLDNDWVTDASI